MSKLALVLLTKDRPEFLRRWIQFNLFCDVSFPVYIADGSQIKFDLDVNRKILNQARLDYNYHGPDINISKFISKVNLTLQNIKEEYCVLLSDDDFPFYDSYKALIEELDADSSLSGAYGKVYDFALSIRPSDSNSLYGKIRYVRQLGLCRCYLSEKFELRLLSYYQDQEPSFWHAIVRTQILQDAWLKVSLLNLKTYEGIEKFINYYFLFQGKIITLNSRTVLFHQVHNRMIAQTLLSSVERLNNVDFSEDLEKILRFFQLDDSFVNKDYLLTKRNLDSSSKQNLNAYKFMGIVRDLAIVKLKGIHYKILELINYEPIFRPKSNFLDTVDLKYFSKIENFLRR